MKSRLSRHPSNIARSALEFLATSNISQRNRKDYEGLLFLFVDYLCHDSSSVIESEDGEFLLKYGWDVYYGGAISNFIDYWMPRKIIGADELQQKAPGILRKWLKWCHEEGYFDKERLDEFLSGLPRGKRKDVTRLQEATELLYRLHSPQHFTLEGSTIPIDTHLEPQELEEGYLQVIRLEEEMAYVQDGDGREIGPVQMGEKLVKLLQPGDVMSVMIGRFGASWRVLESGNVYAKGIV